MLQKFEVKLEQLTLWCHPLISIFLLDIFKILLMTCIIPSRIALDIFPVTSVAIAKVVVVSVTVVEIMASDVIIEVI